MIEDTGSDLLRAADEVARVGSEFKGTVNVTVLRDRGFTIAFDLLNVGFRGVHVVDGW